MKSCRNKVAVFVERGFGYREIKMTCGSTGPQGIVVLCEDCEVAMEKRYPQGWRHYPGDTCRHGVYLNPDYDCNCGRCENGE